MFFTPDGWVGFGVVVFIGGIVVGFATGVGKAIIWLFGIEHWTVVRSQKDNETAKSEIHKIA